MYKFDNWIIYVGGHKFRVIREWGISGRFAFLKPLDGHTCICGHILPRKLSWSRRIIQPEED